MSFSFVFMAQGQDLNVIENLTWDLTDTKMTIRFDLTSPDKVDRSYDLIVKIKVPENIITPTAGITGHIGQRVGVGRIITWYFTTGGYTKRDLGGDLEVLLEATNPNPPFAKDQPIVEAPKTPAVDKPKKIKTPKQASYTPGIMLAILGAGAATFGGLENLTAYEDFRKYERFECLDGVAFTSECWDETLEDANSRRVRAQILMTAGGALVAAGAVMILRTRAKRKNENLSVVPTWEYDVVSGNVFGLDLGLRF